VPEFVIFVQPRILGTLSSNFARRSIISLSTSGKNSIFLKCYNIVFDFFQKTELHVRSSGNKDPLSEFRLIDKWSLGFMEPSFNLK
jgi:hypothetical protein